MEFTLGKSEKGAERGQKTRREIKKCMAKKPENEISQTKFHLCGIYFRKGASTV